MLTDTCYHTPRKYRDRKVNEYGNKRTEVLYHPPPHKLGSAFCSHKYLKVYLWWPF